MLIKVRSRTNKLNYENSRSVIVDSFVLFDSCTEIRIGKAQKATANQIAYFKPKTLAEVRHYNDDAVAYDGSGVIKNHHIILKDPEVCPADEEYHYNIIEWKNEKTSHWHRLVYDTVIFILDDFGRTFNKVQG